MLNGLIPLIRIVAYYCHLLQTIYRAAPYPWVFVSGVELRRGDRDRRHNHPAFPVTDAATIYF